MAVKTNKNDVIANFVRYHGRQPNSSELAKGGLIEYLTTKSPQEVETLLAKNSPITGGKLWADYQKTNVSSQVIPTAPTATTKTVTPEQKKQLDVVTSKPVEQQTATDKANIKYATEKLGYVAPKAETKVERATLYNPQTGEAVVVDVGSSQASQLQSQGYTLEKPTIQEEAPSEQSPIDDDMSLYDPFIKGDPFLTEQFKDPDILDKFKKMPAELRMAYIQAMQALGKSIEAGKVINPNIEISPEQVKEFTDQAFTELDPYYQEQIKLYKQDLDTSISRLQEDFDKGIRRAEEPFKENLAVQAESEAQAGLTYGSERVKRETQNITEQQQEIDDYTTTAKRSLEDLVKTGERKLGSDLMGGVSLPSLGTYGVSKKGFNQTGSLSSSLTGGLMGELPKEQEVALSGRASDLEEAYRKQKILDLTPLS